MASGDIDNGSSPIQNTSQDNDDEVMMGDNIQGGGGSGRYSMFIILSWSVSTVRS